MRIKNKSWSPLVISLPGGKSLTLAGRGTEEVSDEDLEGPEFKRLLKTRAVIVLPGQGKEPADKPADTASPPAGGTEPGRATASPPEGGEGRGPQ